MTDLGSRSDLEALRRSGRGKVVTLMVVLAIALGAAGWYFFGRKAGIGNPEDPAKVIVVARTRGFSRILEDVGFEAAEGTFEAWEQKAKDEVPDLETTGIEAIMTLADRFGYGYVIFEKPQEVDFSALDIDEVKETPEHVRFAVLSAGDMAFPHVMTVNPKPSEVLSGSSIVLLQALFEQPILHDALPGEGGSIDTIQLRDRLREAVDRLAQIPEAEKMAEKIVAQVRTQLLDEERAEPKPGLVGESLESGSPFPLGNGQLLTVSRGFKVVTRDAVRADLKLDDTEQLLWGAPGSEAGSRQQCESLGGSISVHESPRYWMSDDGGALLIQSLSDGLTLWAQDPAGTGCAFTNKGKVSAPSPGLGEAVPASHGQVARAGQVGSQGVVSVVTAGKDDELMLGMLDDIDLSQVAWLSERHLLAVGEGIDGSALYLMDAQTPLSVLRLPSTLFENAESLHEVAVGNRGARPTIVVTAGSFPRKLYRLDLPVDLTAVFESPPVDTGAKEAAAAAAVVPEGTGEVAMPDPADVAAQLVAQVAADRKARGLPVVTALDANRFVVTALVHEGRVRAPHVSADGSWVVFSLRGEMYDPTEPGDSEIAAMSTKGGALKVLTRNALKDHSPRLSPDGAHAVFKTRVEIPKTDWVISSPRVVAVPR